MQNDLKLRRFANCHFSSIHHDGLKSWKMLNSCERGEKTAKPLAKKNRKSARDRLLANLGDRLYRRTSPVPERFAVGEGGAGFRVWCSESHHRRHVHQVAWLHNASPGVLPWGKSGGLPEQSPKLTFSISSLVHRLAYSLQDRRDVRKQRGRETAEKGPLTQEMALWLVRSGGGAGRSPLPGVTELSSVWTKKVGPFTAGPECDYSSEDSFLAASSICN